MAGLSRHHRKPHPGTEVWHDFTKSAVDHVSLFCIVAVTHDSPVLVIGLTSYKWNPDLIFSDTNFCQENVDPNRAFEELETYLCGVCIPTMLRNVSLPQMLKVTVSSAPYFRTPSVPPSIGLFKGHSRERGKSAGTGSCCRAHPLGSFCETVEPFLVAKGLSAGGPGPIPSVWHQRHAANCHIRGRRPSEPAWLPTGYISGVASFFAWNMTNFLPSKKHRMVASTTAHEPTMPIKWHPIHNIEKGIETLPTINQKRWPSGHFSRAATFWQQGEHGLMV